MFELFGLIIPLFIIVILVGIFGRSATGYVVAYVGYDAGRVSYT